MDVRVFVYIIIVCNVLAEEGPIVNTAIGTIRGVRSEDGQYNMYMGIPYARVNESNPFGASIPHPNFDAIFEANDDSAICPQIEEFNYTIVGDLNCLRLNIYTPININANSRLPVFVWIYGGGFSIGFYGRFMYGPKFLVRDDVIVVTMNYRLGPYGFMCLDIPEVPGNQGMKDQIDALRWIKSHISAFGGDPDQITIGGNSAGAVSVDFHLHRDKAEEEKLFNQVVLQSGTTLTSFYMLPLKDAPIVLAKYFEFETNDIYAALDFLATVPPKDLIFAQSSLGITIGSICVEKIFDGVENYLTTNWVNVQPAVNNMKVLIGVNDDELGNMRAAPPERTVSNLLRMWFNTQHEDFQGMGELVDQFYMGDEILGPDTFDRVVNFTSDLTFVHSTYRTIYKYIENNVGDLYFYNFSYVGDRNFVRRRTNIDIGGAYHADEISYVFDMGFMPEEPTSDDQLVIDKMTKMWTNFVKYGDPTPELTELTDVKWEPVRLNSPLYSMNIQTKLSLSTSLVADRITFWDVFYEKNGHLQLLLLM